MVRDAEAAGFNPLTALRNGGAAGFTSTTSGGGSGLSAGLSAAGNFLQNFDPFADAKRDQESRYAEAQIENLNSQSGMYRRTASTPSGPVHLNPGTARLSGSGITPPIQSGKLTATNPLASRGVIDPSFVDADSWEARYSDPGGWVGGAVNAGADIDANILKRWPGASTVFRDGRKAVRDWAADKPGARNRNLLNALPPVPASGNLPAGSNYQLPPMWPTYGVGPLGNY